MKLWKLGPLFDKLPLLSSKPSEKTTSAHIVPVNQDVRSGKNVVLPMQVMRPIIERASGVAIMNECLCRRGRNCDTFPRDFGCLLLGSAVTDLDPALGRIVTPAEAIAHAERALRIGLVPLVVHDATDAWMWGLDFTKMMNICFCCDCCCDVRRNIRRHLSGLFENVHRLPGLTVSVGEGCDSCGVCVDLCMAKAIVLTEEGARIGENCKGCGRCVSACPQKVITMTFDAHVDTVGLTLERYERRTNVGPLSSGRN